MNVFKAVILGLFSFSAAGAQPPDTLWTRIYGGEEIDWVYDMVPTDDDGFVVVGESNADSAPNLWILRLDSRGDTVWTRNWGDFSLYQGRSVIRIQDGHYAAFARTGHLVKFNDTGDSLWTHQLPSGYGSGKGVCQTINGDYALLTSWSLEFHANGVVTMMNESGTILWARGVAGIVPTLGLPQSVRPTQDGGCLVTSSYLADTLPDFNVRVDRLAANGDSLWTWHFVRGGDDYGYDAIETSDGGVAVTGGLSRYTGGYQAFLAKLSSDGEYQWHREYPNYSSSEGRMVQQTADGGYIIGGHVLRSGSHADFYLIRTDTSGHTAWSSMYGTESTEQFQAMCRTAEGGFGMCGWHLPPGQNQWDACVVRTGPDPLIVEHPQPPHPCAIQLFQNYPNPFNSTTTFSFSLPRPSPVTFSVFNTLGQRLREVDLGRLYVGEHRFVFEAGDLPSGVYLTRIEAAGTMRTRKVVLISMTKPPLPVSRPSTAANRSCRGGRRSARGEMILFDKRAYRHAPLWIY